MSSVFTSAGAAPVVKGLCSLTCRSQSRTLCGPFYCMLFVLPGKEENGFRVIATKPLWSLVFLLECPFPFSASNQTLLIFLKLSFDQFSDSQKSCKGSMKNSLIFVT